MKKMGCLHVALICLAVAVVTGVVMWLVIGPAINSMAEDVVIKGLGKYETEKYYSPNNVDYVCYRQYRFESIDKNNLKKSPHLKKVTDEAVETLSVYEADFSKWIDKHLVEGYSFDMSMVDEADYCYILTEEDPTAVLENGRDYRAYTVYVLDIQAKIMHKLEYKQDLYK